MRTSHFVRLVLAVTILLGLCGARAPRLSAQQPAPATIRRVVTGNDSAGKSYVVSDERVRRSGNIFVTAGDAPLGKDAGGDPRILPMEAYNMDPGVGGSYLLFQTMGPSQPTAAAKPPYWNRTPTVDYLMIVSGEIILMLDSGEVTLGAGDVLIQRNTRHAWRNPSTTVPATMWVVVLPVPSIR